MIDIGCGLYGLKDLSQVDFLDCFSKVSECGFAFVEPFMLLTEKQERNLMKNVPKIRGIGWSLNRYREIATRLKELHLSVESAHIILDNISDEEVIASLKEIKRGIGISYFMTSPMISEFNKAVEFADRLNRLNRELNSHDIHVCYHNHAQEFTTYNGEYIMEVILHNTDDSVKMQIDTGWAMYGGCDVIDFMKKYRDRIVSVHLKDFISNYRDYPKNDAHTAVGYGVLPTEEILAMLPELPLKEHGLLIDQDYATLNGDIFEDYRRGIEFIEQHTCVENCGNLVVRIFNNKL